MTTTETQLANPYKVGDGATLCGYSDRHAYTVIAVTAKTVTLQRDKATLLNGMNSGEADALTFTPGGFAGHTEGIQRYRYEANPNGEVIKAHMKKKPRKVWTKGAAPDGGYGYVMHAHFTNGASTLIPGRFEHYDYNF